MIPVARQIDGKYFPDHPASNGMPEVTELRRPSAVDIYREFYACLFRSLDQALANVEVEHKRLLAQHMLFRFDCLGNYFNAVGGMRRDIDNLNIIAPENRARIGIDRGIGEEFLLSL